MKNAWEIAPGLFQAVLARHRTASMMGGGHGIDHVITVAQFVRMIAPDGEDEVAYLATLEIPFGFGRLFKALSTPISQAMRPVF